MILTFNGRVGKRGVLRRSFRDSCGAQRRGDLARWFSKDILCYHWRRENGMPFGDEHAWEWRGREGEAFDEEAMDELREQLDSKRGDIQKHFTMSLGGKPRLGIALVELTPQLGEYFGVKDGHGALVSSVTAGSAAEAAGIKAGDVIIHAGKNDINDADDLHGASSEAPAGAFTLTIMRDKRSRTVTAQLPEHTKGKANALRFDFDGGEEEVEAAIADALSELDSVDLEGILRDVQIELDGLDLEHMDPVILNDFHKGPVRHPKRERAREPCPQARFA